jgi:hypothetical protein
VEKGTYATLAELTFVVLLLSLSTLPLLSSAATVWSDNFNDGVLDNWTTDTGGFTGVNDYLEATLNTTPPYDWSIIKHDSIVSSGTWRFDFYQIFRKVVFDFYADSELNIRIGIETDGQHISLLRGDSVLDTWNGDVYEEWHHIDVTMDESFKIEVFLDATHIIYYQTLDPLVDCELVDCHSCGDGNGIDNVVVSDTIDVVCTDEACTLEHAAIETPTTPTTSTPTTTPALPAPPIPIEMIALAGGAAVVLVVLVLFMKRR